MLPIARAQIIENFSYLRDSSIDLFGEPSHCGNRCCKRRPTWLEKGQL